jgi:hypothetical protein
VERPERDAGFFPHILALHYFEEGAHLATPPPKGCSLEEWKAELDAWGFYDPRMFSLQHHTARQYRLGPKP